MDLTALVGQAEHRAEGQPIALRANRQGSLITTDTILQWVLEGRVFHTQQGNAVTPLDFAETAYDEDQPQFALRVPKATTVLPLTIDVNLQDQAGTDTHIAVSTAQNDIGNGTSTAATITPMRTDAPRASKCFARSLYTGNASAATGLIEIARVLDPFAAAQGHGILGFHWSVRTAAAIPLLVGPATLQWHVVATTTAPQGFSELIFAEFSTDELVPGA